MPTRGCGTRIAGGIYLVLPKGEHGMPVEYFLIDPPRALTEADITDLGIAPQGMSPTPEGDVIDWIGTGKRSKRIGQPCPACIQAANLRKSGKLDSPNLLGLGVAHTTSVVGHPENDLGVSPLQHEVGEHIAQNITSESVMERDAMAGSAAGVVAFEEVPQAARPSFLDPVNQHRGGAGDGDRGADVLQPSTLSHGIEGDSALTVDDPSEVGNVGDAHSAMVLPNCTCRWEYHGGYPNVWDFVAETKNFGMSRRIPSTFDFTLLRPGAVLYALHPRGWVEDQGARSLIGACAETGCPKRLPDHHHTRWEVPNIGPMCIGLHRECVEGGEPLGEGWNPRLVRRTIGDTTYTGFKPMENVRVTYSPALIAAFPIHHIEVVKDLEGGKHEGAAGKAAKSGFSVEVVDE